MSFLLLTKWEAANTPADDELNYINIQGRHKGFAAWILSKFKIDNVISIKVSADRLEFSESSIFGRETKFIPLQHICSVYYKHTRPFFKAMVYLALVLCLAVAHYFFSNYRLPAPMTFLYAVTFAVIFADYMLNKTLKLGFCDVSGFSREIMFKRSVIENIDVTEAQGKYVVELIGFLIGLKQNKQ